jgi:putative intracellular protease/amidase
MRFPNLRLPLLITAFVVALAVPAGAATKYVCPPCNAPCDALAFDQPGICPKCGMTLVDAATAAAAATAVDHRTKVAILLFDGVEIIDSMGPYEVFGAAGYNVYTVGASKEAVRSAMGQTMVPAYTFADAPGPDVLVVPGGGVYGASHDDKTLEFVRSTTAKTKVTMSVCNGAFILAQAGLLDGLHATTTAGNLTRLRDQYPKITVVDDQRYVDNGHIVTTGGLSAGIDGALHLVERLDGLGTAQEVALGEEYDWKSHPTWAPGALAHSLIPNVQLDSLGTWNVVRTEGDANHWNLEIHGTSSHSRDELLDRIGERLEKVAHWVPVQNASAGKRKWNLTGRHGEPWTACLTLEPAAANAREYAATLWIGKPSEAKTASR